MPKINQEDIQILSRNSNWSETDIAATLQKQVYNDKAAWQQFLQLLFISLGIAFSVAGILFFFAYNWADLHKFVKIGLVEGLIIALTLVAVFTNVKQLYKNIILTGTSILVGVLFAVFGQIYQTGANAYDFFMGWTMAIALWTLVSNFATLWLLFLVLINVTFGLYVEQVAPDWADLLVFSYFIIGNSIFLIVALLLKSKKFTIPNWFTYVLAIGIVGSITQGFFFGIFSNDKSYFINVALPLLVLYPLGIYYGYKQKQTFYLSIIPFSIILIISAYLVKAVSFDDFMMLLFVGIFVVVSVTLIIKMLLKLQKKWKNENSLESESQISEN